MNKESVIKNDNCDSKYLSLSVLEHHEKCFAHCRKCVCKGKKRGGG